MSKWEFIDELCRRLRLMPVEEAQRTVMFYSEAIDDRIEDGMSEEEAVASLGSVDDIVRELEREGGFVSGDSNGGDDSDDYDSDDDAPGQRHEVFPVGDTREISVSDTSSRVVLEHSPDDNIHVYCTQSEHLRYSITPGRTLTIRRTPNKSIDIFGITLDLPVDNEEGQVTVQVPEAVAGDMAVSASTMSGSVTADLRRLASLNAKSKSGSVTVRNLDCGGDVGLLTMSGNVNVSSTACERFSVSVVSGNTKADDVSCGSGKISAVSGKLAVSRLSCGECAINTASGKVVMDGSVSEKLTINSVSGNIDVTLHSRTNDTALESVSGGIHLAVSGSEEDYALSFRTVSGIVRAPLGTPSAPRSIRGKTISGNIKVTFQ